MKLRDLLSVVIVAAATLFGSAALAQKRPNVVVLMGDDLGWSDFGAYTGGGRALGHPTPNIDRLAKEGALFTSWYGQASCTAGRASLQTDAFRSARRCRSSLPPATRTGCARRRRRSPNSFKKNGYTTYFSGKWHLGDRPEFYPIEHGYDRDEGVRGLLPRRLFLRRHVAELPSVVSQVQRRVLEGLPGGGQPRRMGRCRRQACRQGCANHLRLPLGVRRAAGRFGHCLYQAAREGQQPVLHERQLHEAAQPPPTPRRRSRASRASATIPTRWLEFDSNIGRVVDAIRAEAPDTIVVFTSDNGAWQDAWPDAGVTPFRGEKGSAYEGAWRVPGIMWAPGRIPGGQVLDQMMSHMDVWPTTAAMAGLTPPPAEWVDNNGKGIYFDGLDNSAYVTGKARHSVRNSWVYIDGEAFGGIRADIGDDRKTPISRSRGSISGRRRTRGSDRR